MKNIFISSTFRDMQAERDLVQEKVLPALREEAKKYGDNVGVIDLRWGVDTSTLETDEGSAKVLKVCLDEIDRSHPYMLIFLGDRYGWIPNGSLIERAVRERGDKYVTDDFEKSVTALEIEYGALSETYGDLSRCIVCFREPVAVQGMDAENEAIYIEKSEKGRVKLEELKTRIQKELGDQSRLISYTCIWDESAQILKDFITEGQPLEDVLVKQYIEMFQEDWKEYENLSWQEKEQLVFRALMESKLRTFVGRELLLKEYYEKVTNATQPIILQGEVGSGKTAIMSKLIDRMQKEGKHVFPFFCGMGSRSTKAELLVKQMIYFVEEELGERHAANQGLSYAQYLELLENLCFKLENKVYIFIDALDQLFEDEHVEKLDFLFNTKMVQMVVSCTNTFELNASAKLRTEQVNIPMLTEEDAKRVAEGILRADSRDYFEELEEALLTKKSIGSPLYISFLIQRLNMMDQEELGFINTDREIASYGANVIREMPDSLRKSAVSILDNAITKVGESKGTSLIEAVRLIAVSRNGLNLTDLRNIFSRREQAFSALDITLLMKYLDTFFYVGEEDRINFTHKIIRQGILEEISDRSLYENEIKEYIKALDKQDMLYLQEGMYYARITTDIAFAIGLLKDAYETESEILLKAITEEAISDDGAFYCQLINQETEKSEAIISVLLRNVMDRFDLSQREMKTKLTLSEKLEKYIEERYQDTQSAENKDDLTLCYCRRGDILRDLGRHEEAYVYYKKLLEYDEDVVLVHTSIGRVLCDMGKTKESLEYYEKALNHMLEEYKTKQDSESTTKMILVYQNMGHVLRDMGRYEEALTNYEKCLEYMTAGEEETSAETLVAGYHHLGLALQDLGRTKEALCYHEKMLKYAEKVHVVQQSLSSLRLLVICYENIGYELRKLGQLDEALAYYEKALACAMEIHEKQQSLVSLKGLGIAYDRMGCIYEAIGLPDKALDYFHKSLEVTSERHEIQNSLSSGKDVALIYERLGNVLRKLNQFEDALICLEKAIEYDEKLNKDQPGLKGLNDLSVSYMGKADILRDLNLLEEALTFYQLGVSLAEEVYEEMESMQSASQLIVGYGKLAEVLRELNRAKEAIFYYEKEFQLGLKVYETQTNMEALRTLSICYNHMGHGLMALGKAKDALAYYVKALHYKEEIYEEQKNPGSLTELATTASNIGNVLAAIGQIQQALNYYKKGIKYAEELYRELPNVVSLKCVIGCYDKLILVLRTIGRKKDALIYQGRVSKYKTELQKVTKK